MLQLIRLSVFECYSRSKQIKAPGTNNCFTERRTLFLKQLKETFPPTVRARSDASVSKISVQLSKTLNLFSPRKESHSGLTPSNKSNALLGRSRSFKMRKDSADSATLKSFSMKSTAESVGSVASSSLGRSNSGRSSMSFGKSAFSRFSRTCQEFAKSFSHLKVRDVYPEKSSVKEIGENRKTHAMIHRGIPD